MSRQRTLTFGLILIITGIILGAFGAHALKPYFSVTQESSFETATMYQLLHGFALITLALGKFPSEKLNLSVILIKIGVVLFSGSIYLLILMNLLKITSKFVFLITPFGGLVLIAGWIVFLLNVLNSSSGWRK
jgi:uncharacterized membrane protein YgdD (TMEM256/DUF423 family)